MKKKIDRDELVKAGFTKEQAEALDCLMGIESGTEVAAVAKEARRETFALYLLIIATSIITLMFS